MRPSASLPLVILLLALGAPSLARAASPLETAVLQAVRDARFDQVIDFGPANEDRDIQPGSARRIAHPPNVDVAVIQLDAAGRAIAWANVLLSRDHPQGLVVPVDLDRGAASVRFRRWDIARWNGGTFAPGGSTPLTPRGWTNAPDLTAADDIVPGREQAPYQFMSPYPASLFKLLVAFHVLRLVNDGTLTLDTPYTYAVTNAKSDTRPLRAWLDLMMTVSDNHATRALLQMLHRRGQIDALNTGFRALGLGTLQVNGTKPEDGRGWQTDRIHMTAFDTARLLWLIEGPPGPLWRGPDGRPVTAAVLGDASRAFLKQILHEQALKEALSTANLAGVPHVRPGIPAVIHPRWIHPTNGSVVAHDINYGVDVRAHNARAEVTFAHKTGLTYNYASDAGIVTSLPGKPFRRYVIAFLSNVGYRYTDEAFAGRARGPYADRVSPIAYSQRIPALARAIDDALRAQSTPR